MPALAHKQTLASDRYQAANEVSARRSESGKYQLNNALEGVCHQFAKCRTPNRRDLVRHVLYLDDYRDMRELVAETLPDAGFKAFVAEAGSWMCQFSGPHGGFQLKRTSSDRKSRPGHPAARADAHT